MKIETSAQPIFSTRLKTEIPHIYHSSSLEWGELCFQQFAFGDVIQQYFLNKLFTIHYLKFVFQEYQELDISTQETTIVLQLNFKQAIGYYTQFEKSVVEDGHYGLLRLIPGKHTAFFNPGEYEMLHIEIGEELLEDLAESQQDIKMLLQEKREGVTGSRRLTFLPINYIVRDIAHGIKYCAESGPDLVIEFKTAILNLLNFYRKGLNNQAYIKYQCPTAYQSALHKMVAEITKDPNKLQHNMGYFSGKHAMSESTLKRAFKAYYKKPLAGFVTEECMKKAAWLLRDSTMSIEDIAFEVGYSEKSGFIRAFKRFHGYTPKQLPSFI